MHSLLTKFLLAATALPACLIAQGQMSARKLDYAPGKSITLTLPNDFDIGVAASGLRRVRFFAKSPDNRVFATGMYNLADNARGAVYILEGWNDTTHTFAHVTHYLDHLRNPNNVAFWTDPATQQSWIYVPLTDKLIRYKYSAGDEHPTSPPEVLMRFPDYGLNYKYGGWHLTRTVAIANLHGKTRLYLTAGSSCNYCQEREVLRAALVSMNPDGSHQQLLAGGLRNAVDLRFVTNLDGGALFATNMGDDHLGDKLPEDTFFELDSNAKPGPIADLVERNCVGDANTGLPCISSADAKKSKMLTGKDIEFLPAHYGWPTCYFANGKAVHDSTPLPEMPKPGDMSTEAERPPAAGPASHSSAKSSGYATTDSAYGKQAGVKEAGTNLAAGGGKPSVADPNAALGKAPAPLADCKNVPAAYNTFAAHSSPLGVAYFGDDNPHLKSSFLVALHGAGHPRIGTGYRVARFTPVDRTPRDFITGFMTVVNGKPVVHGRPCGLLRLGPDSFLLTDDYLGLVYYVHPKR